MTLQEYLLKNSWPNTATIDHVLRVTEEFEGGVAIYIHPSGTSGDTRNFVVRGNQLEDDPRIIYNL